MNTKLKNIVLGTILLGAGTFGGLSLYTQAASLNSQEAAEVANKHVLIASIGYMGGKPAWWGFAAFRKGYEDPNTVFMTFNDSVGCESAKTALEATYRDEMFNGVCIVMPKSGEIIAERT